VKTSTTPLDAIPRGLIRNASKASQLKHREATQIARGSPALLPDISDQIGLSPGGEAGRGGARIVPNRARPAWIAQPTGERGIEHSVSLRAAVIPNVVGGVLNTVSAASAIPTTSYATPRGLAKRHLRLQA
jgi:hypothetical protein